MIDLAQNGENGNVALKDIAARQQISKKYLEIIVRDLVKGGMLEGISGKGGGYRLCRKPEDYTIFEIIEIMEGTLAPVACLEDNARACPLAPGCHTLPLWKEYYQLTHDFGNRTLDSAVRGRRLDLLTNAPHFSCASSIINKRFCIVY